MKFLHLAAVAATVLFAQLSIAGETVPTKPAAPAADAAELDFRAFKKSVHAKPMGPFKGMTSREILMLMEEYSMDNRLKALAFLLQYPDDPRRWSIAKDLNPDWPRFVLQWNNNEESDSQPKIVDEAAAAAWKAKVNELKEGIKTAQDLPEDVRKWLADAAERKAEQKSFLPRWQSGKEQAPDFTTYDIDGKPIRISDYRGKVLILDFWASWCAGCIDVMRHAQELAKAYEKQDVVVLAAGTDDERADFEKFVKENGEKYPNIALTHDKAGKADNRASKALFGVWKVPSQFIIDRKGRVVDVVVGYTEGSVMVDGALAKAGVKVHPDIVAQAAEQAAKIARDE